MPFTSFCEYADTKPRKTPTWFALDESRPLAFFAGIWTALHGKRGHAWPRAGLVAHRTESPAPIEPVSWRRRYRIRGNDFPKPETNPLKAHASGCRRPARDPPVREKPANAAHFAPRPGNLCSIQNAWWAREDSNLQPSGYEPLALTIELRARRLAGGAELEHFAPKRKPIGSSASFAFPSSAPGACLTGRRMGIPPARFEAYVMGRGENRCTAAAQSRQDG